MKKNLSACVVLVVIVFNACKKDDKVTPAPSLAPAKGVYVLSEGNPGGNNTKLAYRDAATGVVSADFFLQQNPTITSGLGNTGNDMIIYGGKMYVVMNISSNVTILNATTGIFITRIPFVNGSVNKEPRYALGYKGKVYVTAYDGTVNVIDTTTLTVTNTINVGPNPEGLAAFGNYLYVANSGGFNTVPDSTVSVVDLNTNTEIKKITACVNPQKIEVNSKGDLYVSSYGDYMTILPTVAVISSLTNTLTTVLGTEFGYDHLRIYNDTAYFYNNYPGTGTCKVVNTLTNTVIRNEFVTDGTAIAIPYGVNIDEQNGDVYIADAVDYISGGVVTCFDRNGVKKFSFSVDPGVDPNKILFVR